MQFQNLCLNQRTLSSTENVAFVVIDSCIVIVSFIEMVIHNKAPHKSEALNDTDIFTLILDLFQRGPFSGVARLGIRTSCGLSMRYYTRESDL